MLYDCNINDKCLILVSSGPIGLIGSDVPEAKVKMSFRKSMAERQEVVVKALVDTGSTDVDLQESKIKALDLQVDESET